MASIITNDYRIFNVESLLKNLSGSTPETYLYLFIGNSVSWKDSHETTSDDSPATPIDSLSEKNFIWNNMISLNRILRSEVSHGIKKRNWVSGKHYDFYRHDYGKVDSNGLINVRGISETGSITYPLSLEYANYYVITQNGNIYICIDNNNYGISTSNPQDMGAGTGFNVFETADHYKWKYVASISSTDFNKFSTLDYHPIKLITEQPVSGDPYELQYLAQENSKTEGGAIYNVIYTVGVNGVHEGVISSESVDSPISIYGDGKDMIINLTYPIGGGALQKLDIINHGTGYTYCYITVDNDTTTFTPIIAPFNGLGSNPIYELCANNLLVNTKLEGNLLDDFVIDNDFRQIGLVVNPLTASNTQATDDTLNACYSLTLNNSMGSDFVADGEIVTSNGTRAKMIGWNATGNILKVNLSSSFTKTNWSEFKGFSVNDTIVLTNGNTPTTPLTITAVSVPEIKHHSGNIIYFENRTKILRDALQIEDINLVIEY